MEIKIKYFDDKYEKKLTRLHKIDKGDWIDVYAAKSMTFKKGDTFIIPLGFAMELPDGYEAYVLPRSSTARNFGIIMANNMGIIDNSYCGDNDEWGFVAHCIGCSKNISDSEYYIINEGDKIGQFRIQEKMPDFDFVEVDHLDNKDRGGFGSTGTR